MNLLITFFHVIFISAYSNDHFKEKLFVNMNEKEKGQRNLIT